MSRGEGCVGDGGSGIDVGEHAERGAVDDDGVVSEEGGGDVGVGEGTLGRTLGNRNRMLGDGNGAMAGDIVPFYAEAVEAVADGLGRTAGAENEFHVYAMEWTENYIKTYVDGVLLDARR